jgi:RNA recognition motif-containing protein
MNIYVGNLNYSTTEEALRAAFEAHGQVNAARLIMDRETGRPRGFGFVEMPDDEEAGAAIAELDGTELDGRRLKVNEARPKSGPRGGGHRPKKDRR